VDNISLGRSYGFNGKKGCVIEECWPILEYTFHAILRPLHDKNKFKKHGPPHVLNMKRRQLS
jgi:hypothetical protein